jgi:DNA-binding NtrC family response regulator
MMSLRERLEAVEREALELALQRACGNRARAARLLATTERIFNYRVRKYGIDWRRFKHANGASGDAGEHDADDSGEPPEA